MAVAQVGALIANAASYSGLKAVIWNIVFVDCILVGGSAGSLHHPGFESLTIFSIQIKLCMQVQGHIERL